MGKNGRVHTPKQTVVAEAWVRLKVVEAVGTPRLEGPVAVRVAYTLEVPRSWSKAKQTDALAGRLRPTNKLDLDNLAKLTCDALLGIAWVDDGQIVSMELTKAYGPVAQTVIEWWALNLAVESLL